MNKFEFTKDEICRIAGWGIYRPKNERFFKCFHEAEVKTGVSMNQFEELYSILTPCTHKPYNPSGEMVYAINKAMNLLNDQFQTPTDLLAKAMSIYSGNGENPFCPHWWDPAYPGIDSMNNRNHFSDFIKAYAIANPDRVEMLEVRTCGTVAIRVYRLK